MSPHKAKLAWDKVCKPKEEGGLGLRSLEEMNKVCGLKLIWRILSAKSLWVRWITRYLVRKGSFWKANDKSSLGSWIWKKLLKYRDLAFPLTRVEIESGSSTSFWFDIWSPLGKLIDLTGARGCIDLGINIDATVEHVVQSYRQRRHRVEILISIEEVIMQLRSHGLSSSEDTRLWKGVGDTYRPNFNTRQTWEIIRRNGTKVNWAKCLWFSGATPKYSVVTWIAAHNRLATGDRILKWSPQAGAQCIMCKAQMETREHLFFSCQYTQEIWLNLAGKLLGVSYSHNWSRVLEILLNKRRDSTDLFLLRYVFQVSVHTIWRERNGRRHGEAHKTTAVLIRFIDKVVRNRISSLTRHGDHRFDKAMAAWFGSRS